MQKSIIVTAYWDSKGKWVDTTDELNKLLSDGWRVVNVSPMGAFGYGFNNIQMSQGQIYHEENGFASLVIVER